MAFLIIPIMLTSSSLFFFTIIFFLISKFSICIIRMFWMINIFNSNCSRLWIFLEISIRFFSELSPNFQLKFSIIFKEFVNFCRNILWIFLKFTLDSSELSSNNILVTNFRVKMWRFWASVQGIRSSFLVPSFALLFSGAFRPSAASWFAM